MTQIEQILAEIERLKLKNSESEHTYDYGYALACDNIKSFINTLAKELTPQPVREFPSSTEMIRLWDEETLPMLKDKDFRGDAERMAYHAFLDGFAKGLSCKPIEKQNLANSAKSSKDLQESVSAKGVDVTDFCQEVPEDIAKCVDEHWDEIIGFKPASEDLEQAAEEHSKTAFGGLKVIDNIDAFKAGAQWQKEQDKFKSGKERVKGYRDGFKACKEQMMKGAVVVSFIQDYKYKTPILTGDIKNKFGLTTGQHVKLIILPSDNK